MNADVDKKLADLRAATREELYVEWQKTFSSKPPKYISQQLMVRLISNKWQEDTYGRMSGTDQKLLDRMASTFKRDPSNIQRGLQIKAGTRLRRLYQGKVHEVTITQDGFLYANINYRSLSEVARLITGTRWNGKLFFGLKPSGLASIKHRDSHDQAQA